MAVSNTLSRTLAGLLAMAMTAAMTAAVPSSFAAPAKAPAKRYTIEQFMATVSMRGTSLSADETRILFSSNVSGIFNVYSQPVAGGAPRALTRSTTDSHYAVSWFPHDDRVLLTRDQGGNELNHLVVRETDGSERDLTPGDKLKAVFFGWTPDGSGFHLLSNERDPKFFDVYRVDATSYQRELVFRNETGMDPGSISRDGRWLALDKASTTADTDVYLYDLQARSLKHLTPHTGVAGFSSQTFDPASKRLLMLSNEGSEFSRLVAYDLATGDTREVERADWDITSSDYSRDGRYRVTTINADASAVVRLYRVGDDGREQPVVLPRLPRGDIRQIAFSASSSRMAFYVNASRSPGNLFVYDFATRGLKQLTQSLSPEIDPRDLVEAKVVRFKSFDGMDVPAILYLPPEASSGRRVPALVYVHGGPGGQTTLGYSAQVQYLVNHGYAVLGINNRGSSGYGKRFFTADDRRHGREPLWDCVQAKTWLAGLGVVDPDRIGIMGGSYGGYMVLAALAFRPEAFKVGVDYFGVANWVRTLESIPPYWESYRQALYDEIGDPTKEHDRLVASSPLFHAQEIRAPLLVVQGRNDPRVIQVESDEIVEAVKKNGVPVDYLVFDDEGHGFSKKHNQIEASRRTLEFLDRYLAATAAPAP